MDSREYADCDGLELAARIRAGALTAAEAVTLAYELIERLDGEINAFVQLEKDAAYAAAATPRRGLLMGVPLAMKDCVASVRGAARSYGSRLGVGLRCEHDDEIVTRYRRAGLIPLGTTNVPEFSSSLSTESRLYGPCRNPWNRSHSVGGSSGGSAAAVAYGAVPIAYGNDSAGSIRIPAACCGAFGFRPGRGRTPNGPLAAEIWYGLLAHHVITRTVRDSALVLDLTEGVDAGAPYGAPPKERPYLEECASPPGRMRVAVSDGAEQGFPLDSRCARVLDDTAGLLEELGHLVVRASPPYSGARVLESLTTLLAVALAEEVPEIATAAQRRIDPETVESCHRALMERGRNVSALELSQVLRFKGELGRVMGRFFESYDVLLTPTLAEPPILLGTLNTDSDDVDAYLDRMWCYSPFAPLANLCGVPSMSVPLSMSPEGLPIGMMFTAPYGQESALFRLAGQLEQARAWSSRHPPISAWSR